MNWTFDLSYSTYSTYLESQIIFFFNKIIKAKQDTITNQVYGELGHIIHTFAELYIENKNINIMETFETLWKKYDIDNKKGFYNTTIKKSVWMDSMLSTKKFIDDNFTSGEIITEKYVEYLGDNFDGLKIKGYIDVFIKKDNELFLYDWKTNTSHDYSMHELQRKFYSWLCYKLYNIIPTCIWFYTKKSVSYEQIFTIEELNDFEKELINFKNEIIDKNNKIENYEIGNIDGPFNGHKLKCLKERERRTQKPLNYKITIHGTVCQLEGELSELLLDTIDKQLSFDEKNKHFIQKCLLNKGVPKAAVEKYGVIHLFNRKNNTFNIGSLFDVKKYIKQYSDFMKKELNLEIVDLRNESRQLGIMPDKLITDKELRYYQRDSIESWENNNFEGYIEIGTGGGKTLLTAEIIRMMDVKTLWIIDRKELLYQTKKEFEELLGIECGVVGDGECDIKDITLATIQTLNSKSEELKNYLSSVSLLIVDESHHCSCSTYEKVLKLCNNVRYRLGTTGTARRDDLKEPIMFSLLGNIVYRKSAEELINEGYLIKPTIKFYPVRSAGSDRKYSEDYKISVSENIYRNNSICQIVKDNSDKKILILVKLVDHGKFLETAISGSRYIHGSLNDVKRKEFMKDFKNSDCSVLICTLSIASEGLNIPSIDMIINAAGNKSDVKSIQILGRVLRLMKNKDKALYIDFKDTGYHTYKHSCERMKSFRKEGHDVYTE